MSTTFQVAQKVRDAVIVNLKNLFTGDPKYPYIEDVNGEWDHDNSKVFISDEIPQESANFPGIMTDVFTGTEQRYLGPDTYRHTKDGSFVVQSDELFASIPFTINIKIYTIGDTRARDELMDRMYEQFKLLNDHLASEGIELGLGTWQPATRTFSGDQHWLVGTMTYSGYTEWTDDLGPGVPIGSIPITLELIP